MTAPRHAFGPRRWPVSAKVLLGLGAGTVLTALALAVLGPRPARQPAATVGPDPARGPGCAAPTAADAAPTPATTGPAVTARWQGLEISIGGR